MVFTSLLNVMDTLFMIRANPTWRARPNPRKGFVPTLTQVVRQLIHAKRVIHLQEWVAHVVKSITSPMLH